MSLKQVIRIMASFAFNFDMRGMTHQMKPAVACPLDGGWLAHGGGGNSVRASATFQS